MPTIKDYADHLSAMGERIAKAPSGSDASVSGARTLHHVRRAVAEGLVVRLEDIAAAMGDRSFDVERLPFTESLADSSPTLAEYAARSRDLANEAERVSVNPSVGMHVWSAVRILNMAIGNALVERIDEIAEVAGNLEIRVEPTTFQFDAGPVGNEPPAYPPAPSRVVVDRIGSARPDATAEAVQKAVDEGARTIGVASGPRGSSDSLVVWAVRQAYDVLFVDANEGAGHATRRIASSEASGTLAEPSYTTVARIAQGMRAGRTVGNTPSLVVLTERFPDQDATASEYVERIRSARPGVLVVYETGYGEGRELAGTDAVVRWNESEATVEMNGTAAPRF